MDKNFWHTKWQQNEISFHNQQPHQALVKYIDKLNLVKESRIFLPLCGKSLDISWLLKYGLQVVGVELSPLAVQQLFVEMKTTPQINHLGAIDHYQTNNLDIFCGDIFDLSASVIGKIDVVYDRAALVALPNDLRQRYTSHLIDITKNAPQLLVCYDYEQKLADGPPFSITDKELSTHYKKTHRLELLDSTTVEGGLKGKCPAQEKTWLLSKRY